MWWLRWQFLSLVVAGTLCFHPSRGVADEPAGSQEMIVRPELFSALTEPPCSYCSTQQLKGLIRPDDRVIAWVRGAHNGGAFPLRHFLAGPRVVNDTYGLFFYDPDGDYVAAYRKDYGYRFHGWRNGIMVVQGPDGSLWSALSGRCFAGPQQGNSLHRVPAIVTNWQYWLMLHPESTAYDLFDGQTYQVTELPTERTAESKTTMGQVDERLNPDAQVLGVHVDSGATAFVLDELPGRACFNADVGGQPVTVFWYARTGTAVAFHRELDGRTLTFYADNISPETAPIKDRETGTRWTLAGRGIDGPLRGRELKWVDSLQCRWFAWSSEYRNSNIHESREVQTSKQK